MSSNELRIGLLAYGAIGDEHSKAVLATDGMALTAVCDSNPDRLTAALKISPHAATFADAGQMLRSGLIDLVVVSTPQIPITPGQKRPCHLGYMSYLKSQWR